MRETMIDRFLAWLELRASRTPRPGTPCSTDRVLRLFGWRRLLARRSTAGNAGSALVEFAITAPLLVSLALGAADYGDLTNQQTILEAATRAGAEYARANPSGGPSWTAVKSTVTSFTTFASTVTPTVTTICTCVDNAPVTCPGTAACASGHGTDTRVIQYVSVAATQNFTPMLAYAASFAFPGSLSAVAVTRTQ